MKVKDFNEFLIEIGTHDLKTIGGSYTWTNEHTCSRTDRAINDVEWMIHMSATTVNILRSMDSDHTPLKFALDRYSK